jgi:hypothetical protein
MQGAARHATAGGPFVGNPTNVIPYCHETHPSQSKINPARDRRVWLSAIGQSLKSQYDALADPVPPHLAALVKQLETREQRLTAPTPKKRAAGGKWATS